MQMHLHLTPSLKANRNFWKWHCPWHSLFTSIQVNMSVCFCKKHIKMKKRTYFMKINLPLTSGFSLICVSSQVTDETHKARWIASHRSAKELKSNVNTCNHKALLYQMIISFASSFALTNLHTGEFSERSLQNNF